MLLETVNADLSFVCQYCLICGWYLYHLYHSISSSVLQDFGISLPPSLAPKPANFHFYPPIRVSIIQRSLSFQTFTTLHFPSLSIPSLPVSIPLLQFLNPTIQPLDGKSSLFLTILSRSEKANHVWKLSKAKNEIEGEYFVAGAQKSAE